MKFNKKHLAILMREHRLSASDLCRMTGKNIEYILDILNGGAIFDRDVAEVIIKEFGAYSCFLAINWEGSGIARPKFNQIFGQDCYAY